jgi:dipeptidyl aminopeptidase/acylaminoacyl peptidase
MKESPSTKPRWRKWLKRIVISLIVLAIVLVYGVLPYLLAVLATGARTRGPDRLLTETPATLGADFKEVEFQTADGVRISGWLLESRGRGATIVYSHGLFRSRRELLARAVDLWKLGFGALLYDARNHGLSGEARVTLGYNERLDAEAAVRFLKEASVKDRIVLFGISMGAAAALLAAAETEEVAAVISDSAYLSFKDTTDHHVNTLLRLPAFPLANEVRFFVERRAGIDGSKLDMLDAVRRIGDRPALFIAGANDRRMPPEIARTLFAASTSDKRDLMIVEGEETKIHGHAYQAEREMYINRVAGFLSAALQ